MSRLSCAFTGHRPKFFPWGYNEVDPRCVELKVAFSNQISLLVNEGYTDFLCGIALGVDTWAAQTVLSLREKYPKLKLHCIHQFLDRHPQLKAAPRTEFVDDGYTGSNTNRPQFQALMKELRTGAINVMVRSGFWGLNGEGGERQRGRGGHPGNTKAPGRQKAIRVQVATL